MTWMASCRWDAAVAPSPRYTTSPLLHVSGMDCAAEEQLIRMALSDLEAINRIEVDLDQRNVIIDHDTRTDVIDTALQTLNLDTRHVDDSSEIRPAADSRRERHALVVALSLAAVGTAATRKKQLARTSGYLQIGLATIGLIEVLRRFIVDTELPNPTSMIALSTLALVGNIATLAVLHRVRSGEAHLQASWIFTANDIKVNTLVIAAAAGVTLTDSAIPRPSRRGDHLRRRRQRRPPYPHHQPMTPNQGRFFRRAAGRRGGQAWMVEQIAVPLHSAGFKVSRRFWICCNTVRIRCSSDSRCWMSTRRCWTSSAVWVHGGCPSSRTARISLIWVNDSPADWAARMNPMRSTTSAG